MRGAGELAADLRDSAFERSVDSGIVGGGDACLVVGDDHRNRFRRAILPQEPCGRPDWGVVDARDEQAVVSASRPVAQSLVGARGVRTPRR
ncbi:hypothetical protein ACFQH2_12495 [Natronoarchaeum sp. GCM10025703]